MAIPLGVLAIILGMLGFNDYRNFNDHITRSLNFLDNKIATTQRSLDSTVPLLQQAHQLTGDLEKLRSQVSENNQRVAALTTKVERVEKFGVEESSVTTTELREKLESTLNAFENYLRGLGYSPEFGTIKVSVDDNFKSNAFFSDAEKRIVLAKNIAHDSSVALQSYAVHALTSSNPKYVSQYSGQLIFGLADYLTCSFLNDSRLGRDFFKYSPNEGGKTYLRELNNSLEFGDMKNKSVQEAGEIWGGAFWELRLKIDQATVDRLLFSTWLGIQSVKDSTNTNGNFVKLLLESDKKLDDDKHTGLIRAVFEKRGLKLEP